MDSHTKNLLNLRPSIPSAIISNQMSTEEAFQNSTLRPIIKMHNDLFILVFKNYIHKHKNVFYDLSLTKKIDYIENAIHKDMKFRNSVKGMIIGQFTTEEFQQYTTNSSKLNKRMMNIVKERLVNQIQLFTKQKILKAI